MKVKLGQVPRHIIHHMTFTGGLVSNLDFFNGKSRSMRALPAWHRPHLRPSMSRIWTRVSLGENPAIGQTVARVDRKKTRKGVKMKQDFGGQTIKWIYTLYEYIIYINVINVNIRIMPLMHLQSFLDVFFGQENLPAWNALTGPFWGKFKSYFPATKQRAIWICWGNWYFFLVLVENPQLCSGMLCLN